MLVLAVSLSEQVEKIGAYAGIAAFFGFAILSILCFAQAREIKRLRDWAGRAPERAAELEARVMADAAVRSRAPVRAATPAAAAAAAPATPVTPAAAAAAPAAAAQANGEAAAPAASDTLAEVPTPAEADAEAGEEKKPDEAAPAAEEAKPAEADAEVDAEAEAETPDGEKAPAVAPAAAAAAPLAAAAATKTASPAAPGNGTPGEIPALPPRATPAPRPGPASQPPRPRPGAAPLRTGNNPAVRRPPAPSPAARRTDPPAPEGRSPGRLAALIAGGVIGLIVLVFAATQIFGGDEETPAPNRPITAETTPAPETTSDTPANTTPSKAETEVAVLNGTFTGGLAATTADKIVAAGFKKGTVGDAAEQTRTTTVVLYAQNARSRALEVAKLLKAVPSTSVEPVKDSENPAEGADVIVIVGSDQAQ